MRRSFSLLFATLIVAVSQSADAQSTYLDLDTAPGNFSVWKVSDLKTSTVAFEATYLEIRKDDKWSPSYTVRIGDGHGQYLSFSGGYHPGSDVPEAKAHLWKDGKDVSPPDSAPESLLKFTLKQTYKVRLTWVDGKVTATVDGNSKEYTVPFNPSEIQITCSTGELKVKNIAFQ